MPLYQALDGQSRIHTVFVPGNVKATARLRNVVSYGPNLTRVISQSLAYSQVLHGTTTEISFILPFKSHFLKQNICHSPLNMQTRALTGKTSKICCNLKSILVLKCAPYVEGNRLLFAYKSDDGSLVWRVKFRCRKME